MAKKKDPPPIDTLRPDYPQPYKTKRTDAVLDEEISAALIRNLGLQYIAARDLGITASTIAHRINQSPYLQAIKEECRQTRIDAAERSLSKMVDNEELGAVCFTLKTLGKERGYIESTQVMVDPQTVSQFEAMMKQIKMSQVKGEEASSE